MSFATSSFSLCSRAVLAVRLLGSTPQDDPAASERQAVDIGQTLCIGSKQARNLGKSLAPVNGPLPGGR